MMTTIEIVDATDADREWAARVMAASEPWISLGRGLEACRQTCCRPDLSAFVARQKTGPLGFILLHPKGVAGSPYIASIGVAPGARGRGIGQRLVAFVENLVADDARYIFLCVSSFNPRAQAFYERLGYTAVGELKDYVVDGASEILMHKRLRRS